MIKLNRNVKNDDLIRYPFLKPINYRDNNSLEINFEEYNNLLLLESISEYIFKFLSKKYQISGFIYLKKGRLSPFSNNYPIISIINTNGLNAEHKQNKIVISLKISKADNFIEINRIFSSFREIRDYFKEKEVDFVNKLGLRVIKNYTLKNNKIIFSSISIAKILHKIKNNFSSTDYFNNSDNIFKNSLNKKIFSHKIIIQTTAYHPLLLIAPFDEIGEEKVIVNLIKNGKLRDLTFSYYEALKYKKALTGHTSLAHKHSKIISLYLKGKNIKLESILKDNKNIIYIENMEIIGKINSLSENFRIKSYNSSYIYKNGKLSSKIENFELNISLRTLFMSVVELMHEKEELGMIVPDILVSLK
jgi:predicted Zn-dependent protease